MNQYSRLSWAIGALLGAHSAGAAAAPEQSTLSSGEIPEVVVTATRRTENMQNVPIAITALTGETLAQLNVQTFEDFVKYLPNVTPPTKGPGQTESSLPALPPTHTAHQQASVTLRS